MATPPAPPPIERPVERPIERSVERPGGAASPLMSDGEPDPQAAAEPGTGPDEPSPDRAKAGTEGWRHLEAIEWRESTAVG